MGNARKLGTLLLLVAIAGGMAAVPAFAGGTSQHHHSGSNKTVRIDAEEVTIEASLIGGYSPASIEIKTGTTVTWHNVEPLDYPVISGFHQAVADEGKFKSPRIPPGARWSFTFLEPGTYTYHCGVHSAMTGEIIVSGAPVRDDPKKERVAIVEPDPNDEQGWGYEPADITVEVGTTVTWANNGAQDHTVTDDDGAFDSGNMVPGDKFAFTFDELGVFNYFCKPHKWMKAVVRVHAPGKPPPKESPEETVDNGATAYPPPLSSGGGGDKGPSTYGVNIVEGDPIDRWGYDPSSLQVQVGDTVVWRNAGTTDHTVTDDGGAFDSGSIGPDDTFERVFDEVGTYSYFCIPHPFMTATIVVSKAPPPNGAQQGASSGLEPAQGRELPPGPSQGSSTQVEAVGISADVDDRLIALLGIAGLAAACAAFLVGRWWGQLIHVRPKDSA